MTLAGSYDVTCECIERLRVTSQYQKSPLWCTTQHGTLCDSGLFEAVRTRQRRIRIPKVTTCRSKRELELGKKRRAGYLAAISRADLTECGIENIRVCSRHFISGKPV